jgi:DNA end-binding protein Ku
MSPKTKKSKRATEPERSVRNARPAWQGSISFGLIHIPVALYGVTTNKRIAFHQLHDADGVRIKQKRICPADGQEVPYEHIVRGYEIEPGQYVVIEPEELEAIDPERSQAIELEKFIDANEIDPLYHESNYYVAPAKGADAPYALLRDAMVAEGRAAVARLVIRAKEHLVALWPRDSVLIVSTLHFADEITDADALIGGDPPPKSRRATELKAARQLVSALSSDFDIHEYRDEYRERVLELIEAKAKGRKIAVQPSAPDRKPAGDLMAALEESLASLSGSSANSAKKRRGPARRRGDGGAHRASTKSH